MAQVKTLDSGKTAVYSDNTTDTTVSLQYPLSVVNEEDRHTSYLVFYAVETEGQTLSNSSIEKRAQSTVTGGFKEKTKAVIQLYMPNMVENTSHNYDSNDGGLVQDLMTNGMFSGATGMDKAANSGSALIDTTIERLNVAFGKVSQRFNAQDTGQVLGSRSAAMYSSSAPRQQTFLFQLRPRNLAELKEVGQILKCFMVNSAAALKGGASFNETFGQDFSVGIADRSGKGFTVLQTPPVWFIEERVNKKNSNIRYTPKFAFGPAGISNIRINKTPDQVYETFNRTAGDSIAIDLELTFTEFRPQFSAYYENLTHNLGKPDSGDFFFNSFRQ
ncbi:TPA: baseplate tail-tube junction protein [Vibrio vulnificus]